MSRKIVAPVCIVGDSGSGKSTAIESLPPDRTLVINTEDKPLPFEAYMSFKVVNATNYKLLTQVLSQLKDPEKGFKYDFVVIDSFTAIAEFIERYVDHMFTGFEQWKQYNLILASIVNQVKALPQQVFMIALPEQKDMSFGETKNYIRVKGKELKYGWTEAQFSIVLYTEPQYEEETGEMEDVLLMFKPNKKNTAKAPRGLFTKKPKNDMMDIYKSITKFYGKGDS